MRGPGKVLLLELDKCVPMPVNSLERIRYSPC